MADRRCGKLGYFLCLHTWNTCRPYGAEDQIPWRFYKYSAPTELTILGRGPGPLLRFGFIILSYT